jgi:hypothetical protein
LSPPGMAFAAGVRPAMRRACVSEKDPRYARSPQRGFRTTPGTSPKIGVAYNRAPNHRTPIKPHGRRSLLSKRVQSCPRPASRTQGVATARATRTFLREGDARRRFPGRPTARGNLPYDPYGLTTIGASLLHVVHNPDVPSWSCPSGFLIVVVAVIPFAYWAFPTF